MRERYLDAFDVIRIDNLNGDKYRTGKVAPDGSPDPSIFSTLDDPVGIQVGTAIATLVRKAEHAPAPDVHFRNLWGQTKLEALTDTAEAEPDALYDTIEPVLPLGLPLAPMAVSRDWFEWPEVPDLFPTSFPGVQTGRDAFLIDTDLDRLKARITDYFDVNISHEQIARIHPRVMQDTARFDARAVRDTLLRRGGPSESGFVRYTYPIVRSTTDGFIGKKKPNFCARRVLVTRHMFSPGTSGSPSSHACEGKRLSLRLR